MPAPRFTVCDDIVKKPAPAERDSHVVSISIVCGSPQVSGRAVCKPVRLQVPEAA